MRFPILQIYLLAAPQQDLKFAAQHAWSPDADPALAMGQLPMQEDALFSPEAHDPEQFSRHSDCAQEVLSGQMHDPACPRADTIPARSRTIEAIASFFI